MADAIKIPSPSAFLRPDSPQSSPASATLPALPPDDSAAPSERPAKSSRHERKVSSSTQTPKKASRKGNVAAAASGDGVPVKPKQTKSRNGCVTCKIKRLKCDEEKPGCKQCARRKVECGGYRKEYKWCPFEETTVKQVVDRQKPPPSPPNQQSNRTSKTATPTDEKATDAPILNAIALAERITRQPTPGAQLELPQRPAPARALDLPSANDNNNSSSSKRQVISPSRSRTHSASKGFVGPRSKKTASVSDTQKGVSNDEDRVEAASKDLLPVDAQSPTLTEILQPFAEDLADGLSIDGESIFKDPLTISHTWHPLEGPLSDIFAFDPVLSGLQATSDGVSPEQAQEALASRYSSPTNSTSTLSSDGFSSSWPTPTSFLFNQPGFAHDSPESLARRFLTVTCPILSIMDGPTENPWRTLIWPLAMQSDALYHAITAMTAYHASSDIKSLHRVGLYHKHQSIKHVMEGIQYKNMKEEAAIATAIALGFSESWEQPIASGNTHIKGAQVLVKDALASHRRQPRKGPALALLKFLCNAWVYMDVLVRLTAVDCDDSEDFDSTLLFSPDAPGIDIVMGKPGFGIDFGMPIDARLDPLMGCANTLFPLIGRVANVVRRVCRSPKNSPAIIETANELKLSLEAWEPPEFIEQPEDPTTQLHHALQTAEAYRWATLLHLQQSVPELPSSCSDEELAEEVMSRLATVPTASRTLVVQIYPLMVAGVLAETTEDRAWVSKRWSAMGQRMRIGVIDKCLLVAKEVWRRRDKYRSTPQEQRKIIKTSELHPVRRKGAPLKRSRDEPDEAPGQTGIVYSWIEADSGGNGGGGGGGVPGSRPQSSAGPGSSRRPGSNLEWYAPYSVRGHLHWIGVMWDWGWEVLLGG
ncbi:hypothetical protein K431DRAFT_285046 [Polychaeton citri CBS 116435]|uniref:Zn(2)-C6 fungal-type domain-containing protein n=1 Tax=Polychaeton citri CBS 116435 TaxID=1314669 RepID=A0A9P4UQN6_9PEZI|nr:hypothetical protein K431DRAFT_285046 [Polychaeton citri CBS 116435]